MTQEALRDSFVAWIRANLTTHQQANIMESMSRGESLSFDIWCAAFAAGRAALCDAARGELVDRLRAYRGPWLGDGIHANVHRDELLAALSEGAA